MDGPEERYRGQERVKSFMIATGNAQSGTFHFKNDIGACATSRATLRGERHTVNP